MHFHFPCNLWAKVLQLNMLAPIPLEYAPLPLGNARSVTVLFSGYHLFKSNFRQNVLNLHQALPHTRVSNTLRCKTASSTFDSFFIDLPKKLFILFLDKMCCLGDL